MGQKKEREQRSELVADDNRPSLIDVQADILNHIGSLLDPQSAGRYLRTCSTIHSIFQPDHDRFYLMQSVIDDDRNTVKKILDKRPELLIEEPKRTRTIESKKTWQLFQDEKPLTVATMRGQLKMATLLLPYFEELENRGLIKDGKAEALKQFKVLEISTQEREEYDTKMKALVDLIADETFPNATKEDKLMDRVSEETKAELESFRNKLLPDTAIVLDHYFDLWRMLIASFKAYVHLDKQWTLDQSCLYSYFVIGFLQSLATPELAKIYCEGLSENRTVSPQAESLKLKDNKSFYRSARDSKSGLGYEFMVHVTGLTGKLCGIEGKMQGWQLNVNQHNIIAAALVKLKEELKSGHWPHKLSKPALCMIQ